MNKIVKVQAVLLSAVIMPTGTVGLQAGLKINIKKPKRPQRTAASAKIRVSNLLRKIEAAKKYTRQERTEGIQHASEHTDGARVSAKGLTGISEREGGISASETSKAFNRTRTGTLGLDLFDKSLQKERTEVFPEESRPQVEQAFDRVNALPSQEPAHRVTLSSKTRVERFPASREGNFVNAEILLEDLSESLLATEYPELDKVFRDAAFNLVGRKDGVSHVWDIEELLLNEMRRAQGKKGDAMMSEIMQKAPEISQAIDYLSYRTYRFVDVPKRFRPVYEADMAVQIHKLWGDLLQGKLDAEVTEQMISDFFTDPRVKEPTLDYAWLEQLVTRVEADYFVNGKLTGIDVLGMSKETTETFLKEGGAKKMNIDASMEVSVGMSTILLTHGLESTPWFYKLVGQNSRLMARIQGLRELVDRQVASLQSNVQ